MPTSCINYKASQDTITVLDNCNNLYKGEVIEFDLNNDLTQLVCNNYTHHTVKLTRAATHIVNEHGKNYLSNNRSLICCII